MKKFYFILLSIILSLSIFNGCSNNKDSSKPLVDVQVEKDYNSAWHFYYYKVKVTALENKVKIENVKVNEGNCKLIYENPFIKEIGDPIVLDNPPKKPLNLGKTLNIRLKPSCNPIKVEVDSDKGNWVWNFKP